MDIKILYKRLLFLRFLLSVLIFILLFLYPLFDWLPVKLGGLIIFIGIFPLSLEIGRIISTLLNNRDLEREIRFPRIKIFTKINLFLLFCILFLFLSPFFLPLLTDAFTRYKENEFKNFVVQLTKNTSTDIERAKVIWKWFTSNRNMKYVCNKQDLLLRLYPLHVYLTPPFICIRLIEHDTPKWVFVSRCGCCAEYSLLFREIAQEANLTVRSIHNPGEDHNWDEVLINGKWIIVDPSWPIFNPLPNFYEVNRSLNVSFVYAEYPNGTRKILTHKYSNVTNISIVVLDSNKIPVSGVKISIISHNYKGKGIFTGLNCTTNEYGECTIQLGGGVYTLKAVKIEGWSVLINQTKITVNENKNLSITLRIEKDIFMSVDKLLNNVCSPLCMSVVYVFLLWIVTILYAFTFKLEKLSAS